MSQRSLFEKAFYRRQNNTTTGAIEGATEVQDLRIDHADDDVAAATATRRAIPVKANSFVEIVAWVEEQWVNGGNAVALTIGDDGSATRFDNSATHQSDAAGELTPSAATRRFYTADDEIDMVITPATTAPSAGTTRVQVRISHAPKPIIE